MRHWNAAFGAAPVTVMVASSRDPRNSLMLALARTVPLPTGATAALQFARSGKVLGSVFTSAGLASQPSPANVSSSTASLFFIRVNLLLPRALRCPPDL